MKKIDVDIGQYSVSCLFNVEKDSFYQTIPSFHLKKKEERKKIDSLGLYWSVYFK